MAGITVSGIGSGLDINGLVSKLVSAESDPATKQLDSREAGRQAELSAIGIFKGALSDFQSAVTGLTDPTKLQGMLATVGDTSVFTATAANSAQPGSYGIEVKNLAQAQSLASAPVASLTEKIGTGTLTIRFGSYDGTTFHPNSERTGGSVVITDANNTLEGVRDAINTAKLGVNASIVKDNSGYRLVLSSADTGAANGLQITASDSDTTNTDNLGLSRLAYDPTAAAGAGKNLMQTMEAKDAQVVINGLTVTSASNTLSETVMGVTLALKSAKPGATTQLDLARDTATTTAAVQAFVTAYNKLTSTISSMTAYNPATGQKGALLGDAQVRSVSTQWRQILSGTVPGNSTFRSLSSVGISVQRNGTLKLDSSKLQAAIETDPESVAKLFTGSEATSGTTETKGLADRLNDFLTNTLDSTGPLTNRTSSINKSIKGIADARAALDRRMQALETRYRAQFTALDNLVSQLTATGNFLTQQLAGVSSNNNK